MQFQTSFPIPPLDRQIDHHSSIVSMGSCFSSTIGDFLHEHKFTILNNPFGTLFHPNSIMELIRSALHQSPLAEELALEREGMYFHHSVHSSISAPSKPILMELLDTKTKALKSALSTASHLILTFGTAYQYRLLTTQRQVANCHKQPSKDFSKSLSSLADMQVMLQKGIDLIKTHNPDIQIILTLSPVRHTKDGIPENQVSKSVLRILCHEITAYDPNIMYFPSYEIMMDELRDYRFYADDLIHPSQMAEKYIWKRFGETSFSSETHLLNQQIEKINQSLRHRPFNPEGEGHRRFLRNLLKQMEQIPDPIDFRTEILSLKAQL